MASKAEDPTLRSRETDIRCVKGIKASIVVSRLCNYRVRVSRVSRHAEEHLAILVSRHLDYVMTYDSVIVGFEAPCTDAATSKLSSWRFHGFEDLTT